MTQIQTWINNTHTETDTLVKNYIRTHIRSMHERDYKLCVITENNCRIYQNKHKYILGAIKCERDHVLFAFSATPVMLLRNENADMMLIFPDTSQLRQWITKQLERMK